MCEKYFSRFGIIQKNKYQFFLVYLLYFLMEGNVLTASSFEFSTENQVRVDAVNNLFVEREVLADCDQRCAPFFYRLNSGFKGIDQRRSILSVRDESNDESSNSAKYPNGDSNEKWGHKILSFLASAWRLFYPIAAGLIAFFLVLFTGFSLLPRIARFLDNV